MNKKLKNPDVWIHTAKGILGVEHSFIKFSFVISIVIYNCDQIKFTSCQHILYQQGYQAS